jgi:hypothetical protein
MADARQAVIARMRELEVSKYKLAEAAAKQGVNKTSVYEWLADEPKRDIVTPTLDVIMGILGMDYVAPASSPAKPKARRSAPPMAKAAPRKRVRA